MRMLVRFPLSGRCLMESGVTSTQLVGGIHCFAQHAFQWRLEDCQWDNIQFCRRIRQLPRNNQSASMFVGDTCCAMASRATVACPIAAILLPCFDAQLSRANPGLEFSTSQA
ncbi:unnamed protein product [Ostreobium quekettii]|uniref:Uncharacterized protein n=1 Tax=Ostreobium quekettii TaxID=121088 RepID=A0A8S1J2K8_9CHLO|nr:unnamed protein product [Ostreobium quekettii]